MRPTQITNWNHDIIELYARKGGLYIDATMGNGHDTLFLCRLAGTSGRVLAFDIQQIALERTTALLQKNGCEGIAELILDSHIHMNDYAKEHSVDVICFNFGYLPGGEHALATQLETDLIAVENGVRLLKPGGLMSLCIYSGKDTGFAERGGLLQYVQTLPASEYTVIVNDYRNKPNHPPIPVFIFKNENSL